MVGKRGEGRRMKKGTIEGYVTRRIGRESVRGNRGKKDGEKGLKYIKEN